MALDNKNPAGQKLDDQRTDYTSDSVYGAVSAPDIKPGSNPLKPGNRAIRDVTQAKNIITSLEVNNRYRNIKNARIMAKYNAEKPYTSDELKADGLDWKSNFTTKPLPSLIDKVAPRFVTAVQGMKYLTNAKLPDDAVGASVKTEAFRREITNTVRQRAGWQNFLSELSQENALFGFCATGWLDEFHWFPKHFRQDEFFVPTVTKQTSGSAQIVVLRERFLMHELFLLIKDREAAEAAGWDIAETVTAINEATPEDRRKKWSNWERLYEDMIRENNVGISYEQGARVVTVWHLLASEIDGQISHYIFDEKEFRPLFAREDQFKEMADATSFFTFQQGNGTVHGSKGIGRELYAMAAMLDRTRNEIVDRLNLSGKMIIQCDEKQIKKFRMSVVGNTILIGKGYDVLDRKLNGDVEPFLQLDQFLTGILDQMAGATTPRVFEGERVTKAQVDFFASREEESKDNIIGRFLNQFADLMTTIQKRLCDTDTVEPDAKDLQRRLLMIMTREEINLLSGQRVAETIKDYTEAERQQIIIVAQEGRGNPLYNQRELERRKLIAQVNEDFADAVLLPEQDPTETAENTRLQMFELDLITRHATAIPISPRDNHIVHLGVLLPAMETTAQQAAQDPHSVEVLAALLQHAIQHFQAATDAGYPKDQLKEIGGVLTKLEAAMPQLMQSAQAQKQLPPAVPPTGQAMIPQDVGAGSPPAATPPPVGPATLPNTPPPTP